MHAHLDASEAPYDSKLEHVLPGMNNHFASMKSDLHGIGAKQEDIKSLIDVLPTHLQDEVEEKLSDFFESFSSAFATAAASQRSPVSDLSAGNRVEQVVLESSAVNGR